MGVEILKLLLGLAAVLGLMYFAWRKASKLPGFGAQGHLNVVERHSLTRNSVVVVIKDGQERVVVAASDNAITELSRTPWVEVESKPADTEMLGKKFGSVLKGLSVKADLKK